MRPRSIMAIAIVVVSLAGASAGAETRRMTLDQALERAFADHPRLQAARNGIEAARENEGVALAGYMPTIAASALYQRATWNFSGTPGQVPLTTGSDSPNTGNISTQSFNYFNFALTLVQPIWDFGRTWNANDVAKAGTDNARERAAAVRLDLWFQVVARYYQALAAQEMVEVAVRTRDLTRIQADRSQGMYKAGARPRIDALQGEATAQAADAAQGAAKEALTVAASALLAAMGQSDTYEVELVRPGAATDAAPPSREDAVAEALAARPERAAAAALTARSELEVRRLMAEHYPILFASGMFNESGIELPSLAWNWQVGVGLTVPIFQGLSVYHGVRAAEARLAEAQSAQKEIDLAIRAEVDQARAHVIDAVARRPSLQAALAAAREVMTLAEQRYKAGEGGQVEVREAQRGLADAEAMRVQGDFDLAIAWASLQHALGRLPEAFHGKAEATQ